MIPISGQLSRSRESGVRTCGGDTPRIHQLIDGVVGILSRDLSSPGNLFSPASVMNLFETATLRKVIVRQT